MIRARVALWCVLLVRASLLLTVRRTGPSGRSYLRWAGVDVDGLLLELREIPQRDLEPDCGRVEALTGAR